MELNNLATKFCNQIMREGKKAQARGIFSKAYTLFLQQLLNGENNTTKIGTHSEKTKEKLQPILKSTSTLKIGAGKKKQRRGDKQEREAQEIQEIQQVQGDKNSDIGKRKDFMETTPNKQERSFQTNKETPLSIIIDNVKPVVAVKKVRKARTTILVPGPISTNRGQSLAVRWIVEAAHIRRVKEKIPFIEALAYELNEGYHARGVAYSRRNSLYEVAQTNRLYIHYRWW